MSCEPPAMFEAMPRILYVYKTKLYTYYIVVIRINFDLSKRYLQLGNFSGCHHIDVGLGEKL